MKFNKHYHPHHIERLQTIKGLPLASFWRRGIAFGIDVFFAILSFLIGLLIYCLLTGELVYKDGVFEGSFGLDAEFGHLVLELLLPIAYFGFLVYFTQGKTIGKWITGIRIVCITHDRISLLHSVERAMAYATSILEFGFGFAQYFLNANHRTLGDKVGETIVVRDRLTKAEKRALAAGKAIEKEDTAVELSDLELQAQV